MRFASATRMFGFKSVILWTFCLIFVQICNLCAAVDRPNIVFIVADDLGWNDVGYQNDKIKTKNIDFMAKNGVILDQSYVQPLCSPSRHAFMTGSYPYHDGLQHLVIFPMQPVCTPLHMKMLPQYLKTLGYATHMVGKWHLGFYKWECTPTYRGFDSFFGFYNAAESYMDHKLYGFVDLHNNEKTDKNKTGIYSTKMFQDKAIEVISNHDKSKPLFLYLPFQSVHDPIEVPKEYEDMYPDIQTKGRRQFSGMVTAMDDAIGNITDRLKAEGLYDNTLFVFTTDNGGLHTSFGNNYPLRGAKSAIYEGGTRGVAFVHGAGIQRPGRVYSGLVHAVDWVETLVSATGAEKGMVETRDGIDQWEAISKDKPGPRNEFVYNFDTFPTINPDFDEGRKAIRMGKYKLIIGYPGKPDGWYLPDELSVTEASQKMDFSGYTSEWISHVNRDGLTAEFSQNADEPETYELYDLSVDPNERNDLSAFMPEKVAEMKNRLEELTKDAVPPNFPKSDGRMFPGLRGSWSPYRRF